MLNRDFISLAPASFHHIIRVVFRADIIVTQLEKQHVVTYCLSFETQALRMNYEQTAAFQH